VPQVPLVGEMAVPDGDADGQYVADRLRVDDELICVRVGRRVDAAPRQTEQVGVVLFLLQASV